MPFDPNTPRSRDEVLLQAIVSGDSSAMGDPRDREEEFVKAIADKETLPDYSEASEGDTLQIGSDGPEWGPVDALPDYSGASAGDVLALDENKIPVWVTGGGENYYLHQIRLNFSQPSSGEARFVIISNDSDAYTRETFFGHLVQIGNPTLDCHGVIENSNSLIWGCKYTPSTLKVQIYILGFTISNGTDIHITNGSGPAINFSNIGLTDNVVKAKIGT